MTKSKKATLEEIKETGASFRSKYIVDTIGKVNAAIEAKNERLRAKFITFNFA